MASVADNRRNFKHMQNLTGLVVRTYSPGDGVTRYRFFPPGSESDYFSGSELYTALGLAEAVTFMRGYWEAKRVGFGDYGSEPARTFFDHT